MPDIALPDSLQALLQPINESSATGEELDRNIGLYESIGFRLNANQTDYKSCIQDAEIVLKEQSKHLQITSWLTLCWLMEQGIEGYRNGLLLMKELLVEYGDQVFPERPKHRVLAFKYLGRDQWVQILGSKIEEEKISNKAALVEEIKQLLSDVAGLFVEKLGESDPPDMSAVMDQLGAVSLSSNGSPAASTAEEEKPILEAREKETEENKETSPAQKNGFPDEIAVSGAEQYTNGEVVEATPEISQEAAQNTTEAPATENKEQDLETAVKVEPDISVPDEVDELLEDISFSSKTGKDIEEEPDDEDNLVYDTLKSEMRSFSGNDYHKCVQLCQDILQNRSKHLRVALFLCISWYRTEGLNGLSNGFLLMQQLLKKYQAELHPLDESKRIKIVQRLNSEARLQMLTDTVLGNEQPKFSVTDAGIKSLKDIPKPIERDLHKVKGQSFVGEEEFWEKISKAIGNKANEDQKKTLIHHFTTVKAGEERISYSIDDDRIEALIKAGLPEDIGSTLKKMVGNEYTGWGRCYDALLTEIGDEALETYESVLKGFMNHHVNGLLGVENAFDVLAATCKEVFDEQPPRMDTLADTIKSLSESASEILDQATANLQEIKSRKKRKTEQEKRAREKAPDRANKRPSSGQKAQTPSGSSGGGEAISISNLEVKWAGRCRKVIAKSADLLCR